jgi:prevent-host-death family protein
MSIRTTASDFAKHFGRYREAAQREPVEITSHGRASGYFVSVHEYQELQRLRALERRAYNLATLPLDLAAAISRSTMDPRHEHLNALLDGDK